MNIIDAEYTPLQGESDPAAYSRRCRRIQNAKRHSRIAYVQRLIAGVVLVGVVALVAAVSHI